MSVQCFTNQLFSAVFSWLAATVKVREPERPPFCFLHCENKAVMTEYEARSFSDTLQFVSCLPVIPYCLSPVGHLGFPG